MLKHISFSLLLGISLPLFAGPGGYINGPVHSNTTYNPFDPNAGAGNKIRYEEELAKQIRQAEERAAKKAAEEAAKKAAQEEALKRARQTAREMFERKAKYELEKELAEKAARELAEKAAKEAAEKAAKAAAKKLLIRLATKVVLPIAVAYEVGEIGAWGIIKAGDYYAEQNEKQFCFDKLPEVQASYDRARQADDNAYFAFEAKWCPVERETESDSCGPISVSQKLADSCTDLDLNPEQASQLAQDFGILLENYQNMIYRKRVLNIYAACANGQKCGG